MSRVVVVEMWDGVRVAYRVAPSAPDPTATELARVASGFTAANRGVRPVVRVLQTVEMARGGEWRDVVALLPAGPRVLRSLGPHDSDPSRAELDALATVLASQNNGTPPAVVVKPPPTERVPGGAAGSLAS